MSTPPDPNPRAPRVPVPPGACDCHFHVTGGLSRLVAARSYTPADTPMADYRRMRRALGLSRGVLVQSSTNGTDNRTLLNALAEDETLRGIAVVDSDSDVAALRALAAQGVVGCRGNMLFSSDARLQDLPGFTHRLAEAGMHLQLLVDASLAEGLEALVAGSPVPVVLDHMGHVLAARGVADPGFQTVLRLLETGKLWVKLSGAYRIAPQDMAAAAPMARALIAARPDRLVWGSDWPHPAIGGLMPNDGALMDQLFDWAGPQLAARILVENAETLYSFPAWEPVHDA
ncbi:MAG: amidohydrolase family protein [Pseudomonadota bacterium]